MLFTLLLGSSSLLLAQTTMCFKENHKSMSTIESTKLDGGACAGTKSVQQMKKEGWEVDDIEISSNNTGKNYIYIFKKDVQTASYTNQEELTAIILAKLDAKKVIEEKERVEKIRLTNLATGQRIYSKKCKNCHGATGEIEAYNTSRKLNTLTKKDMTISIRDINNGTQDNGMVLLMSPYAEGLSKSDVEGIYYYLQTLNDTKK